MQERCKLPQRDLGRSPSRHRIWCILDLNLTSFGNNFDDFPKNQLTEFCTDKRIKTISQGVLQQTVICGVLVLQWWILYQRYSPRLFSVPLQKIFLGALILEIPLGYGPDSNTDTQVAALAASSPARHIQASNARAQVSERSHLVMTTVTRQVTRRQTRSSIYTASLDVPRTSTSFSNRTFGVARWALYIWNRLHVPIRNLSYTNTTFSRLLKTYLLGRGAERRVSDLYELAPIKCTN